MKFIANRNAMTTGMLIRFLPVVLFAVCLGGGFLSYRYLQDTERSARELVKLRAEAVADAIDSELDRAMLTLEAHMQTWLPPAEDLEQGPGLGKAESFLRELAQKEPGFVFSVVELKEQFARVGQDQNFSDRYIGGLETFALPDRPFQTTGFSDVNFRSMDIWFRFSLKNAGEGRVNVRILFRLQKYFAKMESLVAKYPHALFVLKPETAKGGRQLISAQQTESIRVKLPEVNPDGNMRRITVAGDTHLTWTVPLTRFPADVIYAPLEYDLLGDRFVPIALFLVAVILGVACAAFLVFRFSRRQSRFVSAATETINRIRLGSEGADLPRSEVPEFGTLSDAIAVLTRSMDENRARSKVINKSMLELFACNDSTDAVMKCVELICTQCEADTAWFEPFVADQDFYRPEKSPDRASVGWQWKNHRIAEIDRNDIADLQKQYPERQVLVYSVKFGYESIGSLKAYYEKGARELTRLMLDSLVSILEKTLARHEAIRKGVLLSTELDFAKTIQKSIVSAGSILENDPRIAQFYRPADRLGGDWFYVIRNNEFDGCYLIMGSVAGGGISQGLLTSGVKGGLDVLDHIIRSRDVDPFRSPAEIIPLLQRIVVAMNKMTDISITCFVAHIDFRTRRLRVANQRHSLPIVVRPGGDTPAVIQLAECSEFRNENGIEVMETRLEAGDFLVAFSDGLTHAKGFKSEIFERFMVSAIEKSEGYKDATALRDDLKQMYDYYTSSKKQNDDVCFMVVKADDQDEIKKSA